MFFKSVGHRKSSHKMDDDSFLEDILEMSRMFKKSLFPKDGKWGKKKFSEEIFVLQECRSSEIFP